MCSLLSKGLYKSSHLMADLPDFFATDSHSRWTIFVKNTLPLSGIIDDRIVSTALRSILIDATFFLFRIVEITVSIYISKFAKSCHYSDQEIFLSITQ